MAPKTKQRNKQGTRILIEDLRVGDQIVTAWRAATDYDGDKILTDDEVMNVSDRVVASSKKVEHLDLCPSQWRTHYHVNKMDCYDTRQHIWIVL